MGVLTLFKGGREQSKAPSLLVVGVHREERAFGEAVAAQLPAADFDLLRIEQGLSGRRPGPDELTAYRRRHRALYAQILDHITPAHRMVLDLHTGFDEAGPCADVLCADTRLLRCVEQQRMSSRHDASPAPQGVRGVQLVDAEPAVRPAVMEGVAAGPEPRERWPSLKPDIPHAVWCAGGFLYVGIEIYLPTTSQDSVVHARFGAAVVSAAAECARRYLA
ncbi:hypothetical protein CKO31_06620 [Thiohalocapsa halophila]|uniref:N-formylglutamate amidohydrolase n=1 Tax=Thiohalocapsa halophila TaxID=69359 RepID=A0ABS1CEV0_9GAMM|nr:hypothetical protein [Thiohalocapsa halophila]MBK1630423.1 hypothetical protein [Thiohalocapsa halophila]